MERTIAQSKDVGTDQLGAAIEFARQAHAGQVRKQNGRPFIEHPIAIAELLSERDFDGGVLIAAYLHDTVEKTDVELTDIEKSFGPEVARIVETLSEDAEIEGYAARKRALRARALGADHDAAVLYAADRLGNLRDWHELSPDERREAADRLGTTLEERLRLWGEDVAALHDLDPGLPFLDEVELELRELRSSTA